MSECPQEEVHCFYATTHNHGFACDDECTVCHGEDEVPAYMEYSDGSKKQIGKAIQVDGKHISVHVTDPDFIAHLASRSSAPSLSSGGHPLSKKTT